MEITSTHAAGLDIHKQTVVACVFTPGPKGKPVKETRTFGTMTQDLLALADWLTSKAITHVAMESTGEYWKPVYNLLEASFPVLVVNAQHIKTVPGRKTDVKDAEWIADLLRHGLLKGSFIPPLPQRDLRDLTRQRTNLVQDRARVVNQLQKVLEWANLKLTCVVTDIMGVSARAMLVAIIGGEEDQGVLAELAKGRLRAKQADLERALAGHVRDHHRFMLAQHLVHIDFLEEQIAQFDAQIAAYIQAHTPPTTPPAKPDAVASPPRPASTGLAEPEAAVPWEEAVALLDTAPGIGRTVAELLIAEVGTDITRSRQCPPYTDGCLVCLAASGVVVSQCRRSRISRRSSYSCISICPNHSCMLCPSIINPCRIAGMVVRSCSARALSASYSGTGTSIVRRF